MKNKLMLFLLAIILGELQAQQYKIQHGDFWFQDLDCGPFCDAIEKVTEGINGRDFSHMGLVVATDSGWMVLEALSRGVILTPADTFLQRQTKNGKPSIVVGRLKADSVLIAKSVNRALTMLGRPYDHVFDIENEGLYCSELMYFAFRDEYDQSLFQLQPMTFVDPDSSRTFKLWTDYYRDLGVEIPEGKPGLNPGGISRSPLIEIIYSYDE